MDCNLVRENLSSYIDEELTEAEEKEISKHLNECLDCLQEYEQLSKVSFALSNLKIPPISENITDKIMDNVHKESQELSKSINTVKWLMYFTESAAVLTLVFMFMTSPAVQAVLTGFIEAIKNIFIILYGISKVATPITLLKFNTALVFILTTLIISSSYALKKALVRL